MTHSSCRNKLETEIKKRLKKFSWTALKKLLYKWFKDLIKFLQEKALWQQNLNKKKKNLIKNKTDQ